MQTIIEGPGGRIRLVHPESGLPILVSDDALRSVADPEAYLRNLRAGGAENARTAFLILRPPWWKFWAEEKRRFVRVV